MLVTSYSARVIAPFQAGLQAISHATLEIAWVGRGCIGAVVGGVHQRLDPDHVSVVPPGTPHSSWSLDAEVTSHVLHLAPAPGGAGHALRGGLYLRAGRAADVLRAFPAPTAARHELELAARRLFEALSEHAPLAEAIDPRLLRAVRAITGDPSAPWALDALARLAGMSRHHFVRAFRRELGAPPMAYLRRARVERAALLLRSTERSVEDVALTCGFSSAGRLSDAFRAQLGQSPSDWRRARRAEEIERNERNTTHNPRDESHGGR